MIQHIPYSTLGHANHGWLDARHHFSFASYYNPDRMGFGTIRVINDDVIQAGKGFDMHPHQDMEIITYVRSGAITHRDNKGNEGRTVAGDVQVMSAGSGIVHSEYNLEDVDTNIYQIWIETKNPGVQPDWDAHTFPKQETIDGLMLLVSGDGKAPLFIHQDAFIYAGKLSSGTVIDHAITHQAYVLVSEGVISIGDVVAQKGDGVQISDMDSMSITATADAEVLVIDAPMH